MPTSAWHYVSPILQEVAILHAEEPVRSVLDIGCGAGKWGFLLRDLLDFYHRGVYYRRDWVTRIDGVEAFRGYENPVHAFVYDRVHWGDVVEVIDQLGEYDVIFAMEVIEHIPKEQGLRLVETLVHKCNRVVILSFPPEFDDFGRHVLEQKDAHENRHEEHVAVWAEDDIRAYGFRCISPCAYVLPSRLWAAPRLVSSHNVLSKDDGALVLTANDSSLEYEFSSPPDALEMRVLRHPWSSTLVMCDGAGGVLHRENLHAPEGHEVWLSLPVDRCGERVRFGVESNPASLGNEAWVKGLRAKRRRAKAR